MYADVREQIDLDGNNASEAGDGADEHRQKLRARFQRRAAPSDRRTTNANRMEKLEVHRQWARAQASCTSFRTELQPDVPVELYVEQEMTWRRAIVRKVVETVPLLSFELRFDTGEWQCLNMNDEVVPLRLVRSNKRHRRQL